MEPGKIIKTFVSNKGKNVVVRTLQKSDVDDLLTYANTIIDEDTFVNLSGSKKTRKEQETYVNNALAQIAKGEKVHLIATVDGKMAGSFELRIGTMRKAYSASIGISLLSQYRGEGIGSICMQTLIDIAKEKGLRLLELTCFTINKNAIHIYEKMGFKRVGMIPHAYLYKGKYEDELIMYLPLCK